MTRDQLAHILRAACDIAHDPNLLVIGSQSILGSYHEDQLPDDATRSIEADIAFFDDADEEKADAVDGSIGEGSPFHETFGIYGQGVSVATATLPQGWQDRLVGFDDRRADPSRSRCLDPHDLVVSKLVAGREKDYEFTRALLAKGLVDANVLCQRADLLPGVAAVRRRVIDWVRGAQRRAAIEQSEKEDDEQPR